MDNPLTMLQKYYINKKVIKHENGQIIFGNECSWPENVKTNYLIYGCGKNGVAKDYYSLNSLWFLLCNVHRQHSMYVREAASANIPAVRRPDRKALLAYLNGEVATNESIDKFAQPDQLPNVPPLLQPQLARNTVNLQSGACKRTAINAVTEDDAVQEAAAKKARLADAQKRKEQLAAKLDATKENRVTIDDLKSLSEAMTVEKIAAIKAKRLAKKRTTIKSHDDLGADVEMIPAIADPESSVKDIIARERQLRNRTNILQSSSMEFATSVFAILQSVKHKEENKARTAAGGGSHVTPGRLPPGLTPRSATSFGQPPRSRQSTATTYNRYDQERFAKQEETAAGFTINTTCTYHGMSLKSVTDGNQAIPDIGKKPENDKVSNQMNSTGRSKKRPSTTPIIVIPSSTLSLITTLNAAEILQDLRFISNEEKRRSSNCKKESEILIQRRKLGGLTVPYRVIENPLKLAVEDWHRVVAVFVVGPTWQFKGWPVYGGNPVEIFANISAFHMKYDDMPIDPNVARWAVKTINISRTKRHLDRAALMQFWESLDKEMNKKKTHLRL